MTRLPKEDPSLIGAILVRHHGVSLRALQDAIDQQKRTSEQLGQLLLRGGHITRQQLLEALVEQARMRRLVHA